MDVMWENEEGKTVLAPECTPVHERELAGCTSLYGLGVFSSAKF